MIQYKAIIFDADGVIIEPWGFRKILQESYGIHPNQTSVFFKGPFNDCLIGEAQINDILPDYLKQWQWKHSLDDFISLWLKSENQPRNNILSIVKSLRTRGYSCHLASNQESFRAKYIAETMNFKSFFDSLFFSCFMGTVKPERNYYEHITDQLKINPSDIFFVDDSNSHVKGATDFGWSAIQYINEESLKLLT